jgi:hypothetical protein
MRRISDLLYSKKIPQSVHGFSSEAYTLKEIEDFFEDSEIQRVLAQDPIE